MVKNHSFTDGNKRIAAWLFVWYLAKNNYLLNSKGIPKVANNALVAITLMVALSKPEEKELMILVIVNSINKANWKSDSLQNTLFSARKSNDGPPLSIK